jgi:hypothetical protein
MIVLTAWSEMIGWTHSTFKKSIWDRLVDFSLRLQGWKVWPIEIRSNLGNVHCVLASHPERGHVLDFAMSPSNESARHKTILGLLKKISNAPHGSSYDKTASNKPVSHFNFYKSPQNGEAFQFLKTLETQRVTSMVQIANSESIESVLLTDAGKFPAVAFCHNSHWPSLTWNLETTNGINKWPHPIS